MIDPKTIFSPLRDWLLSRGRCIGCGRFLEEGRKEPQNGHILVTCQCQKAFLYQPETNSYQPCQGFLSYQPKHEVGKEEDETLSCGFID